MRAFLLACVAIVIIGTGGYFGLNAMQQPSGEAFATDGARISPHWSWRSVLHMQAQAPTNKTAMTIPNAPSSMAQECDVRTTWQWIFVDFGSPDGEFEHLLGLAVAVVAKAAVGSPQE